MNIHDRARQLSAERQISLSDAYAELGRRGVFKRHARKVSGVLHPTRADRSAFAAVESPRFWWEDR